MRAFTKDYQGFGLHTALDVLLMILAIALLFGWIVLPSIDFIYALALAITGFILVAVPDRTVRQVALGAMIIGTYLVLRAADVISGQLLLYGLASFLFLVGLVGIIRDAAAQGEPALEAEEQVSKI